MCVRQVVLLVVLRLERILQPLTQVKRSTFDRHKHNIGETTHRVIRGSFFGRHLDGEAGRCRGTHVAGAMLGGVSTGRANPPTPSRRFARVCVKGRGLGLGLAAKQIQHCHYLVLRSVTRSGGDSLHCSVGSGSWAVFVRDNWLPETGLCNAGLYITLT